MIPIEQIEFTPPIIGTEDIEEWNQFKDDIKKNGLLHEITLQSEDPEAYKYTLVAGARRLQAMKELGNIAIPAKVFYNLSVDQVRDISLSENLRRKNLAWYDKIKLESELHELRIKQHGQRSIGGAGQREKRKDEGWGVRDTAKELGMAFGTLSEDLKVAEALNLHPHLRKVQDKTTALKLIKQLERELKLKRMRV